MTKDTPTPRTDALVEANRGKPCSQSVDCEFARTLERNLTACQSELLTMHDSLNGEAAARIKAEDDLAACRAALRELVECEDLKDALEALENQDAPWTEGQQMQYGAMKKHYERRKPLALAAARKLRGDGT